MSEEKNTQNLATLSLDDSVDDKNIYLVSQEGEKFEISKKYAKVSDLVVKSFESDKESNELPLPEVKTEILKLVIEYMKHHKGTEPPIVEKPLRSAVMKDVCKEEWDATFIDNIGNTSRDQLFTLIETANYMNIQSLLHLGCAKVASLIKGKPKEEVMKILGVKEEQKPEEKKEEQKAEEIKTQ